jgi:hypothetical protein
MEQLKFKIIKVDAEQFVAISINDYAELWKKIGELEGEIMALKLRIKE